MAENARGYRLQKTGLKLSGKDVLRVTSSRGKFTRKKIQAVANFFSKKLKSEGKKGRIQVYTFHKPVRGEKTLHDGWRNGKSVKIGLEPSLFTVADYDHPDAVDPDTYEMFQIKIYPE